MAQKFHTDLSLMVGMNIQELVRNSRKAERRMRGFQNAFTKISGALGIAFGAQAFGGFLKNSVLAAAKLEGIKTAFDDLNKPTLLDNLRKATSGTVNDLELMQAAVRAENFKIPLEKLATFFEFASKRATQTGESVDFLVKSIIDGIGRKSTLVMDNLGISAAELQKEIKKVGDFGIASGNIIERELTKMGDVADTTQTKIDKLSAAWDNFMAALGGAIVDTIFGPRGPVAMITALADGVERLIDQAQRLLGTGGGDALADALKIQNRNRTSMSGFDPFAMNVGDENDPLTLLNKKVKDLKTKAPPELRPFPGHEAPQQLEAFRNFFLLIKSDLAELNEGFGKMNTNLKQSIHFGADWVQIMTDGNNAIKESIIFGLAPAFEALFDSMQFGAEKVLQTLKQIVKRLAFRGITSLLSIAATGGISAGFKGLGFLEGFAKLFGFAEGGIVTQPTIGMIGEKGPEAVVPLNKGLKVMVTGRIVGSPRELAIVLDSEADAVFRGT